MTQPTGSLHLIGRLVDASNGTFLAEDELSQRCVYKPIAGERPLWDFPDGDLASREMAAAVLAAALHWDVVPTTVLRTEGPLGPGVCQAWVQEPPGPPPVVLTGARDVPPGYLVVVAGHDEVGSPVVLSHTDTGPLRRLALFDVVINNGDRKGSHVLRAGPDGAVLGIDHGVAFHTEDKLRTVLWGWAGDRLTSPELADLTALMSGWGAAADALAGLLTRSEIAAAHQRLAALCDTARFPEPAPGWPRLPWPPL